MAALYLHVGTPKTGTTAIQLFMKRNRGRLEKTGAVYPLFEEVEFNRLGTERNGHWLYQLDSEEGQKCMKQLIRLSHQYDKIILSDEALWQHRANRSGFWRELKEELSRARIELYVIVYLRRQDAYAHSYWAERVKGWTSVNFKTETFEYFLENHIYEEERLNLDYEKVLDKTAKFVGKDHIIVRTFEYRRFQEASGSIQKDFMDAVGIEMTPDYELAEERMNFSVSGNLLEAKRFLNRFPQFDQKEYNLVPYLRIVQTAMKESGALMEKPDFPRSRRRAFLSDYEESNAQTARKYLGREDGILFHEPVRGEETAEEYTIEEVMEACGYILLEQLRERNELKEKMDHLKKPLSARLYDWMKRTVKRRITRG